eukprot:g20001.t1
MGENHQLVRLRYGHQEATWRLHPSNRSLPLVASIAAVFQLPSVLSAHGLTSPGLVIKDEQGNYIVPDGSLPAGTYTLTLSPPPIAQVSLPQHSGISGPELFPTRVAFAASRESRENSDFSGQSPDPVLVTLNHAPSQADASAAAAPRESLSAHSVSLAAAVLAGQMSPGRGSGGSCSEGETTDDARYHLGNVAKQLPEEESREEARWEAWQSKNAKTGDLPSPLGGEFVSDLPSPDDTGPANAAANSSSSGPRRFFATSPFQRHLRRSLQQKKEAEQRELNMLQQQMLSRNLHVTMSSMSAPGQRRSLSPGQAYRRRTTKSPLLRSRSGVKALARSVDSSQGSNGSSSSLRSRAVQRASQMGPSDVDWFKAQLKDYKELMSTPRTTYLRNQQRQAPNEEEDSRSESASDNDSSSLKTTQRSVFESGVTSNMPAFSNSAPTLPRTLASPLKGNLRAGPPSKMSLSASLTGGATSGSSSPKILPPSLPPLPGATLTTGLDSTSLALLAAANLGGRGAGFPAIGGGGGGGGGVGFGGATSSSNSGAISPPGSRISATSTSTQTPNTAGELSPRSASPSSSGTERESPERRLHTQKPKTTPIDKLQMPELEDYDPNNSPSQSPMSGSPSHSPKTKPLRMSSRARMKPA